MSVTTPEDGQADLLSLLERQSELYRRLRRLSERQHELVSQRDPQPLLRLLAERQDLVAQVGALNRHLSDLQNRRGTSATELSPDRRRRADHLLSEVASHLRHILVADEQDADRLRARRSATAMDLAALGSADQACRAYARDLRPHAGGSLATDQCA